jgi:hypothetical protein
MDLMKREKDMVHVRYIFLMGSYGIRELTSMENGMVYLRNIGTMEIYGIREIISMEKCMGLICGIIIIPMVN